MLEPADSEAKYRYFGFFSKSGFTKELEDLAKRREDIILFDY